MFQSVVANQEAVEALGLEHRVYLPPGGTAEQMVVLVHGRAGSADVPWTFARAFLGQTPLIVAPQAFCPDPIGGWSWWDVEGQSDKEQPRKATTLAQLNPALVRLGDFLREAPRYYGIQPKRVIGIGFSQGAAVVSSLSLLSGTSYQQIHFQGVALLCGFIPKIVYPEGSFVEGFRGNSERLPANYFIAHGSLDRVVPIDRAEKARDALLASGAKVTFHQEEVGHKLGSQGMKALTTWAAQFAEER